MKAEGIEAFRKRIVDMAPFLGDRVDELKDWDDVKLLTSRGSAAEWWRPGLLCIGDAAHAMSPIGGVGINLAVQDAVAAANRLAEPATRRQSEGRGPSGHREAAQRAYAPHEVAPTRHPEADRQPRAGKRAATEAARCFQAIQRIPGLAAHPRLFDRGWFRPEHVRTPEAARHRRGGTANVT